MMDEAFFRPGSQRYTEKNQSHGLTTLRNRHMTIEGDAVIFEYRGKSGQEQRRIIEDDAHTNFLDRDGSPVFACSSEGRADCDRRRSAVRHHEKD